jgi:hypothetical protein
MFWKGKEIVTIEHAIEALREIATKEEAAEYLRLAKEEGPYAEHNIGYLFGYFGRDRWKELSELFGILHPIFGDNYNLTDDEILAMGIARGEASKLKRDGQE